MGFLRHFYAGHRTSFCGKGVGSDAHNEARAEAHSLARVEKSLGALKQEQMELANKLTTSERAHLSAEAFFEDRGDPG